MAAFVGVELVEDSDDLVGEIFFEKRLEILPMDLLYFFSYGICK